MQPSQENLALLNSDPMFPLITNLSQKIATSTCTNPGRVVSAVVSFRHGARTVCSKTTLMPPIEWFPNSLLGDQPQKGVGTPPAVPVRYRTFGETSFALSQSSVILPGGNPIGELTALGSKQLNALGRFLKSRYSEKGKDSQKTFLQSLDADSVYCRSTTVPRCVRSLQSVATTLFDFWQSNPRARLSVDVCDESIRPDARPNFFQDLMSVQDYAFTNVAYIRRDVHNIALQLDTFFGTKCTRTDVSDTGVKGDTKSPFLTNALAQPYDVSAQTPDVQNANYQLLQKKIQLVLDNPRNLDAISIYDELCSRLGNHLYGRWDRFVTSNSSSSAGDLPHDTTWRNLLERTALSICCHSLLGQHVRTEEQLASAIKSTTGPALLLFRNLLLSQFFICDSEESLILHDDVYSNGVTAQPDQFEWWGSGKKNARLSLVATHDFMLFPLIVLFGLFNFHWPNHATSFIVELLSNNEQTCSPPTIKLSEAPKALLDSYSVRALHLLPRIIAPAGETEKELDHTEQFEYEVLGERLISLSSFLQLIEWHASA